MCNRRLCILLFKLATTRRRTERRQYSGKQQVNQLETFNGFECAMFHLHLISVRNEGYFVRIAGVGFIRTDLNVYVVRKNVRYGGKNTIFQIFITLQRHPKCIPLFEQRKFMHHIRDL